MNRTTPSALVKIARVCAVALAIGVVGYLVWRAQSARGTGGDGSNVPVVPGQDGPPAPGEPDIVDLPASLSTSKSLAPDVILLPSTKDAGPDTLMPSSKSGMPAGTEVPGAFFSHDPDPALLPSSKFAPIEEELLFSSKSGRPILPEQRPAPLRPNGN